MSEVNTRGGQDLVPSPVGGLSSAIPRNNKASTGVTVTLCNKEKFKQRLNELKRPNKKRLESAQKRFLPATNAFNWLSLFKIDVNAPQFQIQLDPLFQVQIASAAQICDQEQPRDSHRLSGGREHTADFTAYERISVPSSWNAQDFLDKRVEAWLQKAWPTAVNDPIHIEWYPQGALTIADNGPWAWPVGNVSWCTDMAQSDFGIGHGQGRSKTMPLSLFAFLIHRFSNQTEPNQSEPNQSEPETINWVEPSFIKFLLAFCNPSHPLARLSLRQSSPDCLVWQFHIRHFAPVRTNEDLSLPISEGFLLIRQQARMRRMQSGYKAHDKARPHNNDTDMEEQHFEERVLSTSLMTYKNNSSFKLTTVGDSGAKVYGPGDESNELFRPDGVNSHGITIGVSGPLEGPTYFLIAMFWLFESWYKGWDDTLTLIEQLLIFRMDYTMDDKRLDAFMFDNSNSMDLSRQYFTALQLLRIATQWIEENLTEWETFCNSLPLSDSDLNQLIKLHDKPNENLESSQKKLESWMRQRDSITKLLKEKTKQLTDRINRKIEEVESLRDGLFNATSLREASKGMALNRAIYVFTAVTIIYTPMGFMAAIWALPTLNLDKTGNNVHPSTTSIVSSFVLVPIFTYVSCGCLAWYFTSTRSWIAFTEQFVKAPLRKCKMALKTAAKTDQGQLNHASMAGQGAAASPETV